MTTETRQHVALGNGRVLEVLQGGTRSNTAVLYHHGTPFSPVPYAPIADAVGARGLAMVSCSRPGYASSTRQPDRRVADVAADAAEVLDTLGYDRVICIGWSGGGPTRWRVERFWETAAPSWPPSAVWPPTTPSGLDWTQGMGPENVEEFTLAADRGERFHQFLDAAAAGFGTLTGPQVADSLGGLVSEVDVAALRGDFADYLARRTGGLGDEWHRRVVRRRCGVHEPVGLRPRLDRLSGHHLAGRRGPHGALRARPVARRPRARGAPPAALRDEGHISLMVRAFPEILDDALSLAT